MHRRLFFLTFLVVIAFLPFGMNGTPVTAQGGPTPTDTPPPDTATGFTPITVDNVDQLELGFAYSSSGGCGISSPDSTLLFVPGDGVYDIVTWQRRFPIGYGYTIFSPDGTLLAVSEDGVYDFATWQRHFPIPHHTVSPPIFNPDGTMLAVNFDGVYDIATGQRRFAIAGEGLDFSPDGTMLAVTGDGVYDVATGQRLFPVSGHIAFNPAFSPDSALLAIPGDGVYDVATEQRRLGFSSWHFSFNPDGTLLAVDGDGVYEVATWQLRFPLSELGYVIFSPDGTLAAVCEDGLYETATWERRIEFSSRYFSFNPDGTLLAVSGDGVYDVATGQHRIEISGRDWGGGSSFFSPDGALLKVSYNRYCLIYGIAGHTWPYRSGLVRAAGLIAIHDAPYGVVVSSAMTGRDLIVFARTADDSWFRVGEDRWVAGWTVEVLSMPDGVPVGNPSPEPN